MQAAILAKKAYFNPRSLHGERHIHVTRWDMPALISIHAPCTGSDRSGRGDAERKANFNPRSLHGERHGKPVMAESSTRISIHAPCTGSDLLQQEG